MVEPVKQMKECTAMIRARSSMLEEQAHDDQMRAQQMMAKFRKTKSPAHRAAAMQFLKSRAMHQKHAERLNARCTILQQNIITLEEASIQGVHVLRPLAARCNTFACRVHRLGTAVVSGGVETVRPLNGH